MKCILLLLLTSTFIFASTDSTRFQDSRSFNMTFVISKHMDKAPTLDPRIGLLYSHPLFYNFIHIDLSAELSPRPFLRREYEHSWNKDQNGVAAIFSFYPTLYLKHFLVGIGTAINIEYCETHVNYLLIDSVSRDTVSKNLSRTSGGIAFDNYMPGLKIGYRFDNDMILTAFFEPKCVGLRFSMLLSKKSLRDKLRHSIGND